MIAVTTGVISLGIGGAVGYLIAEKKISEKYAKQADEEVAKIRDRYRQNYRDLQDKVSDTRREMQETKDYLADTAEKVREKYDVDNVYEEVDTPAHSKVRYDKIVEDEGFLDDKKPEPQEEEDTGYFEVEGEVPEPLSEEDKEEFMMNDPRPHLDIPKVDPDRSDPFLISDEDYWVNERDHSQSTLVYYINDDVLLDETSQVIHDEASIVGDTLAVFDQNRTLTVVYVRNNRLRSDIEVIIESDPYEGEI